MKVNKMLVPNKGNFIYIIKPTDADVVEGKVLLQIPSLDMLQFGVEGDIAMIPYFNSFGGRPCVAFCNADGMRLNLLPNHLAHMLWETCIGRAITEDQLLGNVVVVVATAEFLERM